MKRWIPFFSALSVGLGMVGATGSPVDSGRYQAIVDRKPFGSETPPASAAGAGSAATAPLADPFVKFLKISAFVRDDYSPLIRVGLVETRTNQSYLLGEGESADGILLIRAEFVTERVLLSKDKLAYWLAMDGTYTLEAEPERSAAGAVPPPAPEALAEAPPVVTVRPPPKLSPKLSRVRPVAAESALPDMTPAPGPTSGATSPLKTLTGRRRMIDEIRKRRAELAQNREATAAESGAESAPSAAALSPSAEVPPPLEGSELERQIQDYQMQAIREGREPLPIPLAPENDEQLVNEGVLPP